MHALVHNREHGRYLPVPSYRRGIRRSSSLYASVHQFTDFLLGYDIHKHGEISPYLASNALILRSRSGVTTMFWQETILYPEYDPSLQACSDRMWKTVGQVSKQQIIHMWRRSSPCFPS